MSYNPTRVNRSSSRKNRTPQPNAGVRHSTIVARQGPKAISLVDIQNRRPSPYGWMVPQFAGDQFEVIYHYFCARNDTGEIRHETQDRCVRVLSGHLFVLLSGQAQPVELQAGGTFTVEKGTAYRLSSSGSGDAELLFIQGPKYDETVEHLTRPGSQNIVQKVVRVDPPAKPVRRTPSKAMDHAQKVAAKQEKRQAAKREPVRREPLSNSSAVSGSNPQPVGPGGYSE